jgi:hypothetical protein
MARPLRLEFAGAVYHLTSRGNARGDIYLDSNDRDAFLDILDKVCKIQDLTPITSNDRDAFLDILDKVCKIQDLTPIKDLTPITLKLSICRITLHQIL